MDKQPTEGTIAHSVAVPAANSMLSSTIAYSEKQPGQQNGPSSNTNGNANCEVAEVDQLLHTSAGNSVVADSIQMNYSQPHEQVMWLPLTPGSIPTLLGQVSSSSLETGLVINQEQSTSGSNLNSMSSLDSSSQTSAFSSLSPSSTTPSVSSSPPGSAALLCSPPAALLSQQGMFMDTLSGRPPHAVEDEEEANKQRVCLWDGCNQEFLTLALLVAHLDRGHTLSMSQYVCYWKDCTRKLKPFDARYKLITHLRCHTGEKPFKCEVTNCNRCFSRLENLKLHVRTHTGEKPYKCHYEGCIKKFNNTSDRAKHMKTHVMRKPYACKYPGCEKSYTDPSSMRKHIKYSHKLKDRHERGSSSGSSTDNTFVHSYMGTNLVSLDSSKVSSSVSSGRNPSLSPPSFVFHSPTSTLATFSSPVHSPHASLPQESATVTIPSTSRTKKLSNGTPLVATRPVISSQPQLIPIPLLQLPSGASIPRQQLGLVQGIQQSRNNMILMPSAAGDIATQLTHPQQQVLMVLPNSQTIRESATQSPVRAVTRESAAANIAGSTEDQNVESQLRQTIAHLQQQLSHTQNLLAHQSAAIAQQNSIAATAMPMQMIVQHNSPSKSEQSRTVAADIQKESVTISSTTSSASNDRHVSAPSSSTPALALNVTSSTSSNLATSVLPSMNSSGGTQIIPILQPQGLKFLYMSPTPHTSV